MTHATDEPETGPLRRSWDWPNQHVPNPAAGVYTASEDDRVLYFGAAVERLHFLYPSVQEPVG